MNALKIYKTFRAAGMTAAGACGMLGNMAKESAGHSINLQDSYNSKFQLTDVQYTKLVDSGVPTYSGKYFVNDEAGYGLCQWTHPDRKKKLLAYAKEEGASIGDEDMQVRYAIHELKTDFIPVWKILCTVTDVYEAAEVVCKRYEMPAVNNVEARAAAAQEYYAQFSGVAVDLSTPTVSAPETAPEDDFKRLLTPDKMMHLQVVLNSLGYDIGTQTVPNGVDGYNGRKSVTALKDLADRLEAML